VLREDDGPGNNTSSANISESLTQTGNWQYKNNEIKVFESELWTSKQRQACSIHEVSYRACFKPQLPAYFIDRLTHAGDTVYDPFSGRGTTCVEAALRGRNVIVNDVNPLASILTRPRLEVPDLQTIAARLSKIPMQTKASADIDLTMFFEERTLNELLSLRDYLQLRHKQGDEDSADRWIRMVATNRLTGHSSGFFSVYTLPPNQAASAATQVKINRKLGQKPTYKDVRTLILKKSSQLLKGLSEANRKALRQSAKTARFITEGADNTKRIRSGTVQLTVTSPPFLDVVQYSNDNWLRCWFNAIDAEDVAKRITASKTIEDWTKYMGGVFKELHRVTTKGGFIAFEVGEIRKGSIRLDEHVVPLAIDAGLACEGVLINTQAFTKTANIWGISNNDHGTNTNRIVVLRK